MRLWGGRFGEENDARVADFTRSIEVDAELALDDLRGSVAHVRGLGRAGILTDDEVAMLVEGLDGLTARRRGGHRRVGPEPRGRPHERRGGARRAGRAGRRKAPHRPVAQRPGRDGPAALAAARASTGSTRRSSTWSGRSSGWRSATARRSCPGRRTSSRPSRCSSPITCWRTSRCSSATEAASPTPGAAPTSARWARAPSPAPAIPLDREASAAELGFDGVTANSLDAVSDRDFVVEALAAAALGMVHLSRLAEEITWWSNPRFGFVRVADAFSTGSSMMPNKRNPDPAELVRGRTAARDRGADGGAGAAQGPAARLPARPAGGQAAAVRGGRDVGGLAWRDGRAASPR